MARESSAGGGAAGAGRKPAGSAPAGVRQSAPDAAAAHARSLLAICGRERAVADRETPRDPAIEWALSGAMALTGAPDEAPRFAPGPIASAMRGAGMALSVLAPGPALAALDAPALLGERAAISGLSRRGSATAGGAGRLLAAGGEGHFLALNLPREEDWQLIPAWLETPIETADRDWDAIARELARREPASLVERGRLMGLAVAEARDRPLPDRPLFRLSHASNRSPLRPARPLRVLDLSTLWAGPLAGSLLAIAGCEVLKVESPERPDGARRGPPDFFDLMNGAKQSCALDLHCRSDRALFENLLEVTDIVIESARPRALAQLGFPAERWLRGAPGRLWTSITGYGREHEWIAFGDDAAIAAGLGFAPREAGSPPTPCFCADAVADPLAGLHAAAVILAHRAAGRGGLLELSLVDVAAHAARLEAAGPLVHPVRARAGGGFTIEAAGTIPVEPPRARAIERPAPPLAAPNAATIARWTASC